MPEAFSTGRLAPMARGFAELLGRRDGELAARVADHAWLLAALRHHRDRPGVPT